MWKSERLGERKLLRRFAMAATALSMVAGTVAVGSNAFADNGFHGNDHFTYLALGDSVAFGYTPPQVTSTAQYENASNFVSYANYTADALDLTLANASCPGETTASMINTSAQSNGCENAPGGVTTGYRTYFPLHVSYSGSQLAYAVSYLETHRQTRLVTITIGANDAFVCEEVTADHCTSPTELASVLGTITSNLNTIYSTLRNVAGYHHTIVALDYYSLSYTDPTQIALSDALNNAISTATLANGGIVADGYGAFQRASAAYGGNPCLAGLLVQLPGAGAGCNIHPSLYGHRVLARAILDALREHGRIDDNAMAALS